VDKCQYDERNDEWILPYIKSTFKSDNGDFKLPDIDQSNRNNDDVEHKNSSSSEGKLSARNNKIPRPSSKDNHNYSSTHYDREEKQSKVETREHSPISNSHALPSAVSMKPPMGGSKSSGINKSKDKSSKKDNVVDTIVRQ
jgi:hypothetical protein